MNIHVFRVYGHSPLLKSLRQKSTMVGMNGHLLCTLLLLVQFVDGKYTILQLTDFHMDRDYSRNGDTTKMCHEKQGGQVGLKLGEYGDYNCDSPMILVKNTIKGAYDTIKDPNLILWTGDSVPHIEGYANQYVVDAISNATDFIKQYYPSTLILPTYGNHDHAPENQFAEEDPLFADVFKIWKTWIGDEWKETFLRGGYYAKTVKNARFLVLNTNLYYRFDNFTFKDPNDPAGQFDWMKKELKAAVDSKLPINIVGHISPGMYERYANFSWFTDEYNRKFLDVILPYASNIRWMIFGHHHTDTFHVIRDSAAQAIQVSYCAPAVTPWYSSLGKGANNPSFRVYESDEQWNPLDIVTYYISLSDLNGNPETTWDLEYRFLEAYDLPDLKPQTIDSKYLNHNTVMHDSSGDITEADRLQQICSLQNADYDPYRVCISRGSAVSQSVILLFFFILLFNMFAIIQ
ncbi:Metallophos domain-containing protein [Aphelenchoides besseyi]|nr:Metallophos domain-containing protein [Aphelenchoides besseyi]